MTALVWLTFVVAGMGLMHRAARLQQLRFSDRRRPPGPWWRW